MALSEKDIAAIAAAIAPAIAAAVVAAQGPVKVAEPRAEVASTRKVVHGGHDVTQRLAVCGHWVNAARRPELCKNCGINRRFAR